MDKNEIYEIFLSRIRDKDLALLDKDDMLEQLDIYLKRALGRCSAIDDVKFNEETGTFTRQLTYLEKDIITLAMVLEWVYPRVNNITNMYSRISDKDYTVFSQSKMLDSLNSLKEETERELLFWHNKYQLIKFMEKNK